jgi:hypothetical protein
VSHTLATLALIAQELPGTNGLEQVGNDSSATIRIALVAIMAVGLLLCLLPFQLTRRVGITMATAPPLVAVFAGGLGESFIDYAWRIGGLG